MAQSRMKSRDISIQPAGLLLPGCAEDQVAKLAKESIAVTITSPPYFRQKDYGVEGQIGWESTVTEYVTRLKKILAGLLRATKPDGSCFIVVGDSYVNKALQLVPARIAIAAGEVGWTLRNDIVWAKTDAAPDGANNRWRFSHEHILFLTKRAQKYKFNADAIRVPYSPDTVRRWANGQAYGGRKATDEAGPKGQRFRRGKVFKLNPKGTISKDVIECSTARSPLDHFATFPPALVERMLLATTNPGDTVLDCFAGTATTGVIALEHDRRFIGIELNPHYVELGQQAIAGARKAKSGTQAA